MSMEKTPTGASSKDLEAAWTLLEESKTLRTDQYARQVLKQGGIIHNGAVLDVGDFLAAREAFLENNTEKMAAFSEKNPEALKKAMVAHSVKPEFEEK